MSVPTTWQSNQVPLQLSADDITYLNVVCKRASNFNGTTSVNVEETDCGIDKGLGTPDWTVDFEGVVNTTPNSGAEVSAKQLFSWWQNKTLLYVKWMTSNGAGGNLYRQGTGYITDYAESLATGSLMAFNFTFNGVGTIDETV
jgi:hypothetical protein